MDDVVVIAPRPDPKPDPWYPYYPPGGEDPGSGGGGGGGGANNRPRPSDVEIKCPPFL